MARGRSFGSPTIVTPCAEPPERGLHHEVALEGRRATPQHAGGPELAERLVRQHDRLRGRDAGAATIELRGRLRPGAPRRRSRRSDVTARRAPPAGSSSDPVLTARAVQRREDHVGTAARRGSGSSTGIRITQLDAMPGGRERVGDPAARSQRDIPLVRDAAREDDDVQARENRS